MTEIEIPNGLRYRGAWLRTDKDGSSPEQRAAVSRFAKVTAISLLHDLVVGGLGRGTVKRSTGSYALWRPGLPIAALQIAVPDKGHSNFTSDIEYDFSDVVFASWKNPKETLGVFEDLLKALGGAEERPLRVFSERDVRARTLGLASKAMSKATESQPKSMYDYAGRVAAIGNALMPAAAELIGAPAPVFSAERTKTVTK